MTAALYLLVFAAGYAVMTVELAAPRLLAPFFGASAKVWTNVIGVILAALSLGYYVGGRLADRRPEPQYLAGIVLGGAGLTALVPLILPPLGRWLVPEGLGLGPVYGLLTWGSLAATVIAFFLPAFFLAMVGPFAIRCLAGQGIGRVAGRVFALGTLGSILGTFATTFLWIPRLGSRLTLWATAAFLAVAALLLARFRPPPRAGVVGGLCLVTGLFALGGPIRGGEGVLAEAESAYQYLRVVRGSYRGRPALKLQVNEPVTDFQSLWVEGRFLTGAYYDHYLLLPWLTGRPGPWRVCLVGLSGGVISRELHHFYPERLARVDGVEVDPVMVRLGKRYFGLSSQEQPKLRVHILDGRVFLAATRERYDLVVLDAYAHQIYIPPHLATDAFFRLVRRRLRPGGVLGLNVSTYRPGYGLVPALANTLARVFGEGFITQVEPGNVMLWARAGPVVWPPSRPPELPRALGPLWANLVRPGRTVRWPFQPGTLVLTDNRSPLERLVEEDLAAEAARYR